MAAYTTNPSKQSKPRKSGGCHCKEEPENKCSCCQTVCFDRPQYHCGHLLSSEDLTLQLHYEIEKNKLRNRALFGCGVVADYDLPVIPTVTGLSESQKVMPSMDAGMIWWSAKVSGSISWPDCARRSSSTVRHRKQTSVKRKRRRTNN